MVLEAKELRRTSTISYRQLATRYGVSDAAIHLAVTGKTFKHLKEA
jgi:predicted kinase